MEKSIQRWAIYGFLISFSLAILLVDYKVITHVVGGYTTEYVPIFDYIVSIIRYSVLGGFAGIFAGWLVGKKKN